MKKTHQKLEQLREAWSAEMATFRELQESNKTLMEEIANDIQKLRQGSSA
ncbi:hypothetical protein LS482_08695 [Sinomicrobium kalidii]|nr:hypothetical protein [Sinomicrobium kalidii]UGU17945.1 hypothetical protein LS482_08695 [Sinomicrobium kalidii]